MRRIYLDHQATTPLDQRVRAAMAPFFNDLFGNAASSSHEFGREAARAVDRARAQTAELIAADRREIVFTSGATEANNLAIKGCVLASGEARPHVVVSAIEHPAVLDCAAFLAHEGAEVSYVGVDGTGTIDLDVLRGAIRPSTVLISVMAANNEIGTLQPIHEIGELARSHGILFHCDAAQAMGKIPIDVNVAQIDLLSISAHKFYGPKGVGALFVRRDPPVRLTPLVHGGGHEGGLRSGTVNVPGCVGLGEACELASLVMAEEAARLSDLRKRLADALYARLDRVEMNGHPERRLPGNLHLTFDGVDAEPLMARCPELAVSSGSACASAAPTPSHVLEAIGRSAEQAECSLRFGLGRFTTKDEVDAAAGMVIEAVEAIRGLTSEPIATPAR
jgi:cysteine desulfurase